MQIYNSFFVPLQPCQAYAVVTDVARVAPCFPGARLNESIDADTYQGEIALKLGPVQVSFAGKLKFTARDPDALHATLRARGKEQRGRGAADADIQMRVEPATSQDIDGANIILATEMKLAGAIAQYGRGAGVINGIAEQLLNDFSKNLEAEIAGTRDPADASPVSGAGLVGRAIANRVRKTIRTDKSSENDS